MKSYVSKLLTTYTEFVIPVHRKIKILSIRSTSTIFSQLKVQVSKKNEASSSSSVFKKGGGGALSNAPSPPSDSAF